MAKRKEVSTKTDIDKWLARLGQLTKTKDWLGSFEAQTRTIDELGKLRDKVGPIIIDRASEIVREALHVTKERFERILQLATLEEVRRALKFTRPTGHDRLPGEEIYPTDKSWIGQYLMYSQHSEAPIGWHFWCGLSVIGAALRRNLYIDMNNHYLWPNLYLMIVAESAARKSTAINTSTDIIKRLNRQLIHNNVDESQHIAVAPKRCTPERFIDIMKTYEVFEADGKTFTGRLRESTGFLAVDELVTLLGNSTYNPTAWVELLTTWYDCPAEWKDSTLARGDAILYNVAITAIMGSTADWIRSSVTDAMFGGGFMGRCLFIPRGKSGRIYPYPEVQDPVWANHLAELLVPLVTMQQQEFTCDESWRNYFHDWYLANDDSEMEVDERLSIYYRRKPSHLQKVAMLLAVSDGRFVGTAKDLILAERVLSHEEQFLPQCFGEMSAHPDSIIGDKIINVIERAGGTVAYSTLVKKLIRDVGTAKNLQRILDSLASSKQVKRLRVPEKRATYFSLIRKGDEEG